MTMTGERFAALAEAYGGDIARWPADEREAATAWLSAEPETSRRALALESALDAALDAWRPLAASAQLRAAVGAAAPQGRSSHGKFGWLVRAGLGAGLAGTCAAGLLVGSLGWIGAPRPADSDVITAAMSSFEITDEAAAGEAG